MVAEGIVAAPAPADAFARRQVEAEVVLREEQDEDDVGHGRKLCRVFGE